VKLAFFTPLNPQKTGISDYSEELLPFLAKGADIDIYIKDNITPTTPEIVDNFSIFPYPQFARCHQQKPYDLCLYQMGNNTICHQYMDAFIQTYPGIVTLHDYALHHFYAEMFADEHRYDEYQQAMETYYGELGRQIAIRFRQGIRNDYVYYQLPFYQRVVNPSLGTIVHSSYVKTKLLNYNPAYRVEMINMGILCPVLERYNVTELRENYQIEQERFVIASVGFIIEGKRIRELVHVFAQFVKDVPDALLLLVGKESPTFKVRKLLNQLQLTEHVRITGYVPYEEYFDYIALSDVCVNLRYPTVRATSANILKIMAFAKPVLVSDLCELLDIPGIACLKIPFDDTEEDRLLNAFHVLHTEQEYRETLGQQARAFVEQHHSMQQAAENYLAFCREIVNS
jgi:glycosyltransferase involved in cell wall biosynthesis